MDEKILHKLEALMRMAEDPGATEAERENAQTRVSELLTKHQIDASALDPHSGRYTQEDIEEWYFTVPHKYQMHKNRSHGLFRIIKAFGADAFACRKDDFYVKAVPKTKNNPGRRGYHVRGAGVERLRIFAPTSVMETLKFVLPHFLMQEMTATERHIKQFKETDFRYRANKTAQEEGSYYAKEAKNENLSLIRNQRISFAAGWYVAAAKRMAQTRNDVVSNAGDEYALVLVDTEARIKAAMGNGLSGVSRGVQYSGSAWRAGSEAGSRADVGNASFGGGRVALN